MDYTKRAALLCCACYASLLVLSFIPSQSLFGIEFRRANVLSDLVTFNSDNIFESVEFEIDAEEYAVDLEQVEQQVEALNSSDPIAAGQSFSWSEEPLADSSDVEPTAERTVATTTILKGIDLVPIEKFDTTELNALSKVYRKLLSPDSLVRIAVLGDSFIEADILTADLRETLQSQYGGCGTGFAPVHSALTQYRKTVNTHSTGWTSYNIMQHRTTPAPYNSLFSISGWVSLPSSGASTTWKASSAREHLDSCQCVRLQFLALNDSAVEVSINGGESRTFDIKGSESLRQIELRQRDIHSVTMRVVSGADGFVGYGAYFEGDRGVVVDNYSVRSNNGQAMFWTAAAINAQIDRSVGGYDLVILQYGLNILNSGVNIYTSYGTQVEKMINYAQKCFPKAAIIVLGVSDRSTKKNGIYEPMPEAKNLLEQQRAAAENQGVNFWSTYSAMQAQGGMNRFVVNGWAAKDYTHITYAGGRQVAWALADAISAGVEAERTKMVVKVEYGPVINRKSDKKIKRWLSFGEKWIE